MIIGAGEGIARTFVLVLTDCPDGHLLRLRFVNEPSSRVLLPFFRSQKNRPSGRLFFGAGEGIARTFVLVLTDRPSGRLLRSRFVNEPSSRVLIPFFRSQKKPTFWSACFLERVKGLLGLLSSS